MHIRTWESVKFTRLRTHSENERHSSQSDPNMPNNIWWYAAFVLYISLKMSKGVIVFWPLPISCRTHFLSFAFNVYLCKRNFCDIKVILYTVICTVLLNVSSLQSFPHRFPSMYFSSSPCVGVSFSLNISLFFISYHLVRRQLIIRDRLFYCLFCSYLIHHWIFNRILLLQIKLNYSLGWKQ